MGERLCCLLCAPFELLPPFYTREPGLVVDQEDLLGQEACRFPRGFIKTKADIKSGLRRKVKGIIHSGTLLFVWVCPLIPF